MKARGDTSRAGYSYTAKKAGGRAEHTGYYCLGWTGPIQYCTSRTSRANGTGYLIDSVKCEFTHFNLTVRDSDYQHLFF